MQAVPFTHETVNVGFFLPSPWQLSVVDETTIELCMATIAVTDLN
jgi:hypothetical protein